VDELVDIFVAAVVQIGDRAVPDNPALVQHRDLGCELAGGPQIARDGLGGRTHFLHALHDPTGADIAPVGV